MPLLIVISSSSKQLLIRIYSLFILLKDKKNTRFRGKVADGEITASRVVTLSPAEMASEVHRMFFRFIHKQIDKCVQIEL